MHELVLIESRTARQEYATQVDVLDHVKPVDTLPDGMHVTTEILAAYFVTNLETIKSLVRNNREELESNGHRVLRGAALAAFVRSSSDLANLLSPKARSLALFDRRSILNVAMLLTQSDVARSVRSYLLDREQTVRDMEARALKRREPGAPITWTFDESIAIIRQRYGLDWTVAEFRRLLRQAGVLKQTGAPKAGFKLSFWHTGCAYEIRPDSLPLLTHRSFRVSQELAEFPGIQMRLELEGFGQGLPELIPTA
jgi:hypothetical protein